MRAALYGASIVKHDDAICGPYGRESMRDNQSRAVLGKFHQSVLDFRFTIRVEGIRRFQASTMN